MKTIFNYKDHEIVFQRTLSGAELSIDGVACDRMKDGMKALLVTFSLSGEAVNEDGNREQMSVKVEPGFLLDTVTLICNGREVENKQVR